MPTPRFALRLGAHLLALLAIAALAATPAAAASPSDSRGRLSVTLTCSPLAAAGRGEGMVGGASFSLTCGPSAPVALSHREVIGDPNLMPWSIGLSETDVRGSTMTCAGRGTGLPARLVCRGISNREQFVSIEAVRALQPD